VRGYIKLANVSIKYKKKARGTRYEVIKSPKVQVLITISENPRSLKFKSRTIYRVCKELGLKQENLIEPDINSVEILKDLGRTAYDV